MNAICRIGTILALPILLNACVTAQNGPTYSVSTGKQTKAAGGALVATVKPGAQPGPDTDEAGWRLMYDKAEQEFQTSGLVVRDPGINRYMRNLVCKIAGPYCGDIRVYVLRAPYFNATMGPNGAMQVWTGLLLRVRNEAQLVAVLGHEIGHYLRNHGVERMRNAVYTSNALAFFQLATAGAGVGIIGSVGTLVALAQITAYGRDQEREADRFGHQFLVEQGYDPWAASEVWQQLIAEQSASEDEETKSLFLSTHPLPDERMETLAILARDADSEGLIRYTGGKAFDAVFLTYRKTLLQDELNLRRYDRFDALLDMLIGDGKQVAELHFFRGELFRLRGEEGDLDRALKEYETALQSGVPPAEIHRSLGELHQKRGRKLAAKEAFRRYLEAKPNAVDADIIRYMLGKLS